MPVGFVATVELRHDGGSLCREEWLIEGYDISEAIVQGAAISESPLTVEDG